jgi:anti-anti-sigma regulatory factor
MWPRLDQMVTLCHGRRVPSLIHAELMPDHTVIITVAGVAAYQSPDQMTGAVRAAIVRWAPESILLDMADVSVIDTAGVGALLDSHRTAGWAGIPITLINVGTFLFGQLRETGITALMEALPVEPAAPDVVDATASA